MGYTCRSSRLWWQEKGLRKKPSRLYIHGRIKQPLSFIAAVSVCVIVIVFRSYRFRLCGTSCVCWDRKVVY